MEVVGLSFVFNNYLKKPAYLFIDKLKFYFDVKVKFDDKKKNS